MSFAREGYPMMAASGAIAAGALASAVWRRSWALWILAILLLLVAIWVAWTFRTPAQASSGVTA